MTRNPLAFPNQPPTVQPYSRTCLSSLLASLPQGTGALMAAAVSQVAALFESGKEVYRGYVDDPRNTDNAWTETTAFHFHCSAELGAKLQLGAGDDAGDVAWLDVDEEEERYRDLYGAHRALVDKVASGMQDSWTAVGWLSNVGVAAEVAGALLGGARPFNELQAVRALAEATTSEAALAERLRAGGVIEALAKAVLPQLQQLRESGALTGKALHGKFAQEGKAFTMKYGDLSTFFGGLEAKIGAPDQNVRSAMEREHTAAPDSHDEFTSSNYGVTTTPATEWWFVAEPDKSVEWPVEERLTGEEEERRRRPMQLDALQSALDERNRALQALNEPLLLLEEAFGARLYTGAMCDSPPAQNAPALLASVVRAPLQVCQVQRHPPRVWTGARGLQGQHVRHDDARRQLCDR